MMLLAMRRAVRRHWWLCQNVCFGSKADLMATQANVRFVPTADLDEGQVKEIGQRVSEGEDDTAPERVAGEVQLSALGD